MKFTDNYSHEFVELTVLNNDGQDILRHLVETSPAFNNGYIVVNENTKEYLMSTELLDWWKTYAKNLQDDIKEINNLSKIYGDNAVQKILSEEFDDSSYSVHHASKQRAFERIKNELKPIK